MHSTQMNTVIIISDKQQNQFEKKLNISTPSKNIHKGKQANESALATSLNH